jgi:hypothetical protein
VDGQGVLLRQGDSTSASGWLSKSKLSFDNNCLLQLVIARKFADFCLTHENDHYTRWLLGKENKVADMLLHDFELNNKKLTQLVKHT